MAQTGIITQAGNYAGVYSFSGGLMTNREVVVCELTAIAGNTSGGLLSNVTAYANPTHYYCTVTSVGSQPISFQLLSNAV